MEVGEMGGMGGMVEKSEMGEMVVLLPAISSHCTTPATSSSLSTPHFAKKKK